MTPSQNVLITGVGSGFGRLTALTLAAQGYGVFGTLRDPRERDATVAAELRAAGISVLTMDVTSDESVAAAFAELTRATQRLDVVVNNAGISAMGLNEGFDSAQLSSLLQVNAVGPHRVTRAALPLMKPARRGLLVYVSTGIARTPLPAFGLYAASKAALEAIAEAYRYELAPLGIDSVIVQPSAYPTRLGAAALAPAEPHRLTDYGELAQLPERMMAGLASWFASPQAPNPRVVADAVVALIRAPSGTRPLRTTVGGGPDELNALSDRLQAATLKSQGLGALLTLDNSRE